MNRRDELVIVTRRGELPAPGTGTVLSRCISAGVPLASACSGRGACGKCIVRVVGDASALSRMTRREALVLARNDAAPGERLSCMCRIVRPGASVRVRTGYW
jgi:ferredoxin